MSKYFQVPTNDEVRGWLDIGVSLVPMFFAAFVLDASRETVVFTAAVCVFLSKGFLIIFKGRAAPQ